MVKRNQTSILRLSIAVDFLLVFFAYLFAAWFRLKVLHGWRENAGLSSSMILASAFYAAGLLIVLAVLGFYTTARIQKLSWKIGTLFVATTLSISIVTALIFAFKVKDVSRGIILIFYLLTLFLLGGKQILVHLTLNQLRSRGVNIKHELLVGKGKVASQYQRDLADEPGLGIVIDRTLSVTDDLERALAKYDIDEVVFALEAEEYPYLCELIAVCEKNAVRFLVIPFYNEMMSAHPLFETIGGSKLIDLRASLLEKPGFAFLKRFFDLLVSAVGLVVLSPLFLVLAIGVKRSSPGPVFFRQTRVGKNGRAFRMLKFRSMPATESDETGESTAEREKRTGFGSFLQRASLNELPQLWNVLKGEMSLVGPRAELPDFIEQYREEYPRYMEKRRVRPGMTGLSQVNGYKGEANVNKRVELDLQYIDRWSPGVDLKILFRAVPLGHAAAVQEEEASRDVKLIVATHKNYWMPSDPLYLPVQVGAEGKKRLGFTPDNSGDNISAKNANYCELTGLYWAWKNLDCDYFGLAHYRRHFTIFKSTNDRRDVLRLDQACQLFRETDVLLPKPRNYWIETNYQQYIHAHHTQDLDMTRAIIAEKYPMYVDAYDAVMKKSKGHRFNMFLMKKELADAYCAWLFDILFELERRLDITAYHDNDRRVFGFVAERLLDVWLEANQIAYKDLPYIFLDKQNWVTKIANFLKRKLESKKRRD